MPPQKIFVLTYNGATVGAQVLGAYTSLELAKAEGQKNHRKAPLVWNDCVTDVKGQVYSEAPSTAWHTPVTFTITSVGLDARKFR